MGFSCRGDPPKSMFVWYSRYFIVITPFLNFLGVQRERENTPSLNKSLGEKSNTQFFTEVPLYQRFWESACSLSDSRSGEGRDTCTPRCGDSGLQSMQTHAFFFSKSKIHQGYTFIYFLVFKNIPPPPLFKLLMLNTSLLLFLLHIIPLFTYSVRYRKGGGLVVGRIYGFKPEVTKLFVWFKKVDI